MNVNCGRWMLGLLAGAMILSLGCGATEFMPLNETFQSVSWVEFNRVPGNPQFVYKGFWAGDRRRLECWVRPGDTVAERLYFVAIYNADSFAVVVKGRLHADAKRGEYDIQNYPRDRILKVAGEIMRKGKAAGSEFIDGASCRRFSLVTDAGDKSSEAQVWVDDEARVRQILLTGLSDQNRFEQRIHSIRYNPPLDERLFKMPVPRGETDAPVPES